MPVYICRLVTQSVCSRAEQSKGKSGGNSLQREIDSLRKGAELSGGVKGSLSLFLSISS